jgi:peptide-methionine (S)-S-oxide reductase
VKFISLIVAMALPVFAGAAEPARAERAVFAGGCFWGIEAVFQHVKGVSEAVSGYAGGSRATARYEIVSSGMTDHAEAVEVTYDPAVVSYETLLSVFFKVAHDPTQLNRQGPDTGPQYRSAIFYANDSQKAAAQAFIAQLGKNETFRRPIVTQVAPLEAFFAAEEYHQEYASRHPRDLYIVANDAPKVANLKRSMPELYVSR